LCTLTPRRPPVLRTATADERQECNQSQMHPPRVSARASSPLTPGWLTPSPASVGSERRRACFECVTPEKLPVARRLDYKHPREHAASKTGTDARERVGGGALHARVRGNGKSRRRSPARRPENETCVLIEMTHVSPPRKVCGCGDHARAIHPWWWQARPSNAVQGATRR